MAEIKNVIVFALGPSRFAVELRWVEEVFTLGYVTPVPGAPAAIVGVVNRRGAITPVLDLAAILAEDEEASTAPLAGPVRRGHSAILLQVDDMVAAIPISNVVEVATLARRPGSALLVDSRGGEVTLMDPVAAFQRAVAEAEGLRHAAGPTGEAGDGG